METGRRIEKLMESRDITQKELADKTGINKSVLNRVILGTRSLRDDELLLIANTLNVTVDSLLGNTQNTTSDLKDLLKSGSMTWGGEEISEHNLKVLARVAQSFLEETGPE